MSLVRACALQDFDVDTGTCTHEIWIQSPGVLPPLSATEGGLVATAMITVVMTAWALKFVRRYLFKGA